MKSSRKKEYLIKIITKVLETNIELMTYYKEIAIDSNSKKVCTKSIRQSKLAIDKLPKVKHIEILESLYKTLISGKEVMFVSGGSLICSKQFYTWDKTEKGFKEFLMLEEKSQKEQEELIEKKKQQQEILKKAKEENKKVEWVYKDNELKPMIVE